MATYAVCIFLGCTNLHAADEANSSKRANEPISKTKERLQSLLSVPSGYRTSALHFVIEEASRVARELDLAEALPISETNLVAAYIAPPQMARRMGTVGSVTTSNYIYYVSRGRKFSSLVRTRLQQEYEKLQLDSTYPMSKLDTNGAYQLATQFLAAVSVDVKTLVRECDVYVLAFTPEGSGAEHFVPVYWVYWMPKGEKTQGSVAEIEIFQPTKTVRQLHVKEPKYVRRAQFNLEWQRKAGK